jgi:tartronate-semialdehyde synthase
VIEFILERVTNISMGTEIDNVNEFEDVLCLDPNLALPASRAEPPPKVLEPLR